MKRRSLLAGAPAFAAVGALPAAASPPDEAPSAIVALFRQWHALYAEYHDKYCPDDEMDAVTARMHDLEKRIAALPSTDMTDLAIKVIVETSYWDFVIDKPVLCETTKPLVAEIEALVEAVT